MKVKFGTGQEQTQELRMIRDNLRIGEKALVLYILLMSSFLWREALFNLPYLPFLPFMDAIPGWVYSHLLLPSFLIGGAFVLLGFKFRTGLILFGGILIFSIISSMPIFSNSLLFAGIIVLLGGLFPARPYVFNIQIALLYFGASINKLFDTDWWNGHFFDTLATVRHPMPLYNMLAPYFGDLVLAQALGVFTIGMELFLAILFLFPKKTNLAVGLGLTLHIGILILTKGSLSLSFLYIMSCAYLTALDPISQSYKFQLSASNSYEIKGIYIIYLYFFILLSTLLSPIILSRL
ncbi:hypothetical protein H7U19_10775 [Hyunsoonleella sp. SJ7]|uniref:HTTM domain-containing protein n=1 Tax=Hyunsoonleella aquatilis TaxID=2762758 RepID=A0A923H929_9FLAO|nr:hypothetical protein [Hyunsoonleella aquatilis]MBC3758890.1 hypothetical protein [Hyunsoonleella aquatilis]